MAASLAAPGEPIAAHETTSDDEERINAANAEYQASREAFREEERRRRAERIKVPPVASATPETALPTPPPSTTAPTSVATSSDPSEQPLFNRPYVDSAKLSDRAQMEQERLARQAARNAQPSGSNPAVSSSTKGASTSQAIPLQASAGPSRATGSHSQSTAPRHPLQAPGPFPSDAAGEYYPDGELRNSTLTIGQETSERTFDARDVIGRVRLPSRWIRYWVMLADATSDIPDLTHHHVQLRHRQRVARYHPTTS
jgi:tyrosyl-DNA phosphodiesterase-1